MCAKTILIEMQKNAKVEHLKHLFLRIQYKCCANHFSHDPRAHMLGSDFLNVMFQILIDKDGEHHPHKSDDPNLDEQKQDIICIFLFSRRDQKIIQGATFAAHPLIFRFGM